MNTTDTSEKGLEGLITNSLMADAGYGQGLSSDYDKTYCVDRVKLFAFSPRHSRTPPRSSALATAG